MLREILTFELGLNVSMTGFVAPPSTTDSTTPLYKCVPGQGFYYIKRNQDYSSPIYIWIADVVGKKKYIVVNLNNL